MDEVADADRQWREEEDRKLVSEAYEVFQSHFRAEQASSLARAVETRSHQIIGEVRTEIDFAKSAYEEVSRNYEETHTGWMNPLVTCVLRSYRAIEWYQTEVGVAVGNALMRPFKQYLENGGMPNPWVLLRPDFVRRLRDAAINDAFSPEPLAKRLQGYLDKNRTTRNEVAHTLYVPDGQAAHACLSGAIEIHNVVDKRHNAISACPLALPEAQ